MRNKALYGLLGSGVTLAFFGHGVLGAKGEEKFVALVTGTYDKVLGGTMSNSTATSWVNAIGWLDITLAVVFAGLTIAALTNRDRIAYSPAAMYLFGWAMVWGFLTALSRFTAEMNGKEVWDVVERGPNYLLPAALVYIVYKATHATRPEKTTKPAGVRGTAVPTH